MASEQTRLRQRSGYTRHPANPGSARPQLAFPGLWGGWRERKSVDFQGLCDQNKVIPAEDIIMHPGTGSRREYRSLRRCLSEQLKEKEHLAACSPLQMPGEEAGQPPTRCMLLPHAMVLLRDLDEILSNLLPLITSVIEMKSWVQQGSENTQYWIFLEVSLWKREAEI